MNHASTQGQSKWSVRNLKVATIAFVAVVMATFGLFAASALAQGNTSSDSASPSATQVNVTITDSGNRSTAQREFERAVYNVGDNLVLKWKGATVAGSNASDFVVPTQIKYGTTTVEINTLIAVNQLQDVNTEYARRMKSNGNMATFNKIKTYVEDEHSIDLGTVTAGVETVTITWQKVKPVYRLYNMITSEHLFTTNKTEYDSFETLSKSDSDAWIGEGISWLAPESGEQVYRFYNAGLGSMGHSSHYYSKDATEIANLEKSGWTNDGAVNGFMSGGSTAIWTCYNEGLGSAHHYTSSKSEWSGLNQHGWALEEDKNGTNGVFQGALATSWSYDDNYYKVNHNVGGTIYTEWKAGKAGSNTNAVALSYPGYSAGTITNKRIAADNSTTVDINYTANKTTVTFNTQGGSAVASQTVAYGAKITAPQEPTKDGFVFNGWSFDEAGTVKVNLSTYTMPAKDLTLFAQWRLAEDKTYTVILHSQNGSGTDQRITRTIGDGQQLTPNPFSYTDGTTVYGFKTWNTKSDGTGTDYADRYVGDLATEVGATVDLFAQWTTGDLSPFWIAPASKITTGNTAATANQTNPNYTNPETGVVKTNADIIVDIQAIRSNSEGKEELEKLYTNWMDTDSYHLYAKLNGATGEDAYVEFRLVNLLGHESTGNNTGDAKYDDNAIFTIQAIHAMPLAYAMNSGIDSNAQGWAGTDLRKNMNSDAILQHFSPEMTSKVNDVQKWNRSGQGDGEKVSATNDKLWLMSYTELVGEAYSSWGTKVQAEGDQYQYWSKIQLSNNDGANVALQALTKTRSGNTPVGSQGGSWLRSAYPSNSQFGLISNIGGPGTQGDASKAQGVVPCLAAGTINHRVTFDTGDGSAVDSQSVPTGGFAEIPDQIPASNVQGFVFEGWYKDSSKTQKFDFETEKITGDITLYAKYVEGDSEYTVEVYHELDTVGEYPEAYSETFKTKGITSQQTDAANAVTTKGITEGYEVDKVENVTITGDGSAVAKAYLKRATYTITFDKNGKAVSKFPESTTLRYNTTFTEPTTTPEADSFDFVGWFEDSEGTTEQVVPDFWKMPAKDVTLYAKWEDSNKIGYNVEHYLQNADGTWATEPTTKARHRGEADTQTNYTAVQLNLEGFKVNPEGETPADHETKNVKIESDGSTTLKIYYWRNKITVKFYDRSSGQDEPIEPEADLSSQYYGSVLKLPTDPTVDGLIFDGWLLNSPIPDTGNVVVKGETTVPNTTEDLNIYCNWSAKEYFFAPASTITTGDTAETANVKNDEYKGVPTIGKKKTATEIDKDLTILRDKNNSDYSKVVEEYKNFMNTDSVHLYVKWLGSTVDSSGKEQIDNQYLEFRIIHVGEHDNDGSVLTFQMTHTIPTAFALGGESVKTSGWEGSVLRSEIQKFGEMYKKVMGNFKTLTKKSMKGGVSQEIVETQDDFWIASATEIYGGNCSAGAAEGVQYDWFKKVLKNAGSGADYYTHHYALVKKTRAGFLPLGENTYDGFQGRWWTRTPEKDRNNAQITVTKGGAIWSALDREKLSVNYASGVAVCFAL